MGYEEADRQKTQKPKPQMTEFWKSRKAFKTPWEICTSHKVCHTYSILIHFLQGSQYRSNAMQNKDKPQEIAFFFC